MNEFPDKDGQSEPLASTDLLDVLQETRESTREQLEAAWRIHVGGVAERLESGWREHIAAVFEERFSELADRVGAEVESRVAGRLRTETAAAVRLAERAARRRLGEALAAAARRLERATEEAAALVALLQGLQSFSSAAGVLLLSGNHARLVSLSAGNGPPSLAETTIPVTSAAAVGDVVASRDCVVAVRNARQISEPAMALFSTTPGEQVTLLPIVYGGRVAAVICAAGEMELGPLEVLASLAGPALANAETAALVAPDTDLAKTSGPAWASRDAEQQEEHLRARRVARVQVAEIRLYQSKEVIRGRALSDLYGSLKPEIDSRREAFRKEFFENGHLDTDYFHRELLHTLANDDESLLGKDYPGPLVS